MLTARPDRRLASLLSAPPTAVRSFAQDDELAVFSQVYDSSGNAPHSVEIVMSVSTPDGTPVFADRDTRPSGERSNSTAIHDFVSRVPLTGLAPGEYILSVEAKSQLAAEAAATRRVHFTVVAAALRSPVSVPTATARASAPTFLAVDPEYSSLVTQYRRGNVQAAIASLAKWPSERVRAVTRNGTGAIGLDVRQTEAAVMLHSDVAMFLAALDPRSSRQQLEAAQMLVATLPDEGPAGFRQRWEAYAVGTYLVQHDFRAAQRAVDEGVGRLPRNADLLLMKGTLMELAARSETADFRGTWTTAGGINRMASTIVARMEDTLVAAANAYERALELDPSLTSARLRLGWVYGINHSNAHAREQLRTVANGTSSRELRYLARLFLGGLSDIDGDPEGAYNEYEAAHATLPDAQSGCISLMRAARMTGRTDLEQELLAQYAARPGAGEDPWWYFSMGFDTDLVAWLHARATAP